MLPVHVQVNTPSNSKVMIHNTVLEDQEQDEQAAVIPEEAEAVMDSYRIAQGFASQGKEFAGKAVAEALRCGAMLLALKASMKHGRWMKYREDYLPQISVDNAKRWMQLAKSGRALDLKDASSLRQAYK